MSVFAELESLNTRAPLRGRVPDMPLWEMSAMSPLTSMHLAMIVIIEGCDRRTILEVIR